MSKEYIEREAALACKQPMGAYGMDISSEDIKAIPAADVVPVVRCKDCQLCEYEQRSDGDWHRWCLHFGGDVDISAYDFCSYGRRKRGDK